MEQRQDQGRSTPTTTSLKVLNLTSVNFDSNSIAFLSLGKSFTPHLFSISANFHFELLQTARTLRFKHFFNEHPKQSNHSPYIVYQKSKADPPESNNQLFNIDINFLENTITNVQETHFERQRNLKDTKMLASIRKNRDLHFCNADKGGALVIISNKDYSKLVYTHLSDTTTYSEIYKSRSKETHNKICSLIADYNLCFSKDEISYFINHDYQDSKFYVLPKIHKSETVLHECNRQRNQYIKMDLPSDLSTRPIVNNINSSTSRISHFVHKILLPILPCLPGYTKDSFNFLSRLNRSFDSNHLFVTFDVTNLYTVIPHELGLEAVDYWISIHQDKIRNLPKQLIFELNNIILKHNTFTFEKRLFVQINGTAMGTKMAPAYANLVLAFLEVKLFNQCEQHFGKSTTTKITQNYFRYLDDIFIKWHDSFGSIDTFHKLLNNLHPNFIFIMKQNKNKINFLDILLYRKLDNTIGTDIYHKPTDSFQYLHFFSNHPRHIKRNVPYTLASRISKIVSENTIRQVRFTELQERLLHLKYPKKLILDAIKRACCLTLKPKTHLKKELQPIPLTFSTANMRYFTTKLRPRLETLNYNYFNNKLQILPCCRQLPNLTKQLNNFQVYSVKKCRRERCLTCVQILERKMLITVNNHNIYFNKTMTCISKNVIYLLICDNCKKLYIGETKLCLNLRVNLHRQHITRPEYGTSFVSTHLRSCGSSFHVVPLFQLPLCTDTTRKKLEQYFINLIQPELNSLITPYNS